MRQRGCASLPLREVKKYIVREIDRQRDKEALPLYFSETLPFRLCASFISPLIKPLIMYRNVRKISEISKYFGFKKYCCVILLDTIATFFAEHNVYFVERCIYT